MSYNDTFLNNFIVNRVSSLEKLKQMEQDNLLEPNQIYLVESKNYKTMHLPIGMIFPSAVIQNDAGLHLLDGAELPRDGIYAEFYNWVDANRTRLPLADSPVEYEYNLTRYDGQCGLFLITDTYVRLPKITHYIENAKDPYMLGIGHRAGIPNITGSLTLGWTDNSGGGTIINDSGSGSLYSSHKGTARWRDANDTSTTHNNTVNVDASRSSDVYGRSDTVQPKSIEYPYYIVISSILKTDIEIDINNIINDLDNKSDKNASNLSDINVTNWQNKLNNMITPNTGQTINGQAVVVESYLSSDGKTWYRKWSDGWKECGGAVQTPASADAQTIAFSITFDSVPIVVMNKGYNGTSNALVADISAFDITTTYFKTRGYNAPVKYLALGY